MKPWREFALWGALAVTALLAVLSVAGAFFGAERAAGLFNSPPLVAFWMLATVLLAGSLFWAPAVRREPGLLAMHVGAILVLVGGMWGSNDGHDLARRFFGREKVQSGCMVIAKGQTSSDVFDPETGVNKGQLPFAVKLRDFWIDYYPPPDPRWVLFVQYVATQDGHGDGQAHFHHEEIAWDKGGEYAMPGSRARFRVQEYLAHARRKETVEAPAALEIETDAGDRYSLPAKVGQEAALKAPKITVKILRTFGKLIVHEKEGGGMEASDEAPPSTNPAVEVQIRPAEGAPYTRYVFEAAGMPQPEVKGVKFRLVMRPAEAVLAEDGPPAMEVALWKADGQPKSAWLVPEAGADWVRLPISAVLDPSGAAEDADASSLVLVRPVGPIQAYNSDVEVLVGERVAARKVIQVNHPLHYGGYHFYQHSYDEEGQHYTVLGVVSDSGLWAVLAGASLLVAGAFWQCWFRTAWTLARKRRTDAH